MANFQGTIGQTMPSIPVRRPAVAQRLLVAAIDLGTTYSGYAFQTREDFLTDPTKINVNHWQRSGGNQYLSHKTTSCILFNPDKEFDSFGDDAVQKYNQLASADVDETHKWYFFKHFKMVLYHEQELTRSTVVIDDKYNTMPALDVFTQAIKYLREHLMNAIVEANTGLKETDVHWVLTVPAIWNDKAKMFMRESAINAGIHTDSLSLSLEPEAASLFCRYIKSQRVESADGTSMQSLGIGDKYMIIDAGGGTVDMTIHEILDDSTLREIDKANGGDWGGAKVDENFQTFLDEVFGPDVMEIIKMRFREDFLSIMNNFEIKKRTIEPCTNATQSIQIPASVLENYTELNKVQDWTDNNLPEHLKGKVTYKNGRLRADAEVFKGFFDDVCLQIGVIAREFYDSKTEDLTIPNILLVGGFSESKMLQGKIKELFPRVRLIIPEDASLVVVKGAVVFGHNPAMITSRVCKYTYGIRAFKHFEPGLDPPEKRVVVNKNIVLCKDSFSKHAEIGQQFRLDETVCTQEYVPSELGASELDVWVYTSPRKYPRYVDEENCTKIGEMRVSLTNSKGEQCPVSIEFSFGLEELKVHTVESKTNKKEEANFKLLEDN